MTRLYGRGLLCAALQDCVDLRTLSLGDPLPQYKHSGPFAERIGSAFLSEGVAPLVASVCSSIAAGTPGCVRISAPMQPLFDILVDQKVCTQMVRDGAVVFEPAGQVRCYIDCKWSASADQQDQNLSTWVNHRVKPFLGKASCMHACIMHVSVKMITRAHLLILNVTFITPLHAFVHEFISVPFPFFVISLCIHGGISYLQTASSTSLHAMCSSTSPLG